MDTREFELVPFCEGYDIAGIWVRDMAPIKRLWVPVRRGLNVFYGVTGVGKSTVLRAISDGLQGIRPSMGGRVILHLTKTGAEVDDLGGQIEDQLQWAGLEELEDERSTPEPRDLYHSVRVTLEAAGTDREPRWHVGIAAVPTSVQAAIEAIRNYDPAEERAAKEQAWKAAQEYYGKDGNDGDVLTDHLNIWWTVYNSLYSGDPWYGAPRITIDETTILEDLEALQRQYDSARSGVSVGFSECDIDPDGVAERVFGLEYVNYTGHIEDERPRRLCVASGQDDINGETNRILKRTTIDKSGNPDRLFLLDGRDYVLSERLTRAVGILEGRAAQKLDELFETRLELHLHVFEPNWWPERGLSEWRARDPWGAETPIDRLGTGLQSSARIAISVMLASLRREGIDIVLDEPERGLHASAQAASAAALQRLCRDSASSVNAFVATHSPAFLSLEDAHVIRLDRYDDGGVVAVPLDLGEPGAAIDDIAHSLGITRSDLLLVARWIILVEGEHDVSVVQTLFGEELRSARALLFPMNGADYVRTNIIDGLITYSFCRVRIVLDGIDADTQEKWETAVSLEKGGERKKAEHYLADLAKSRQREVAALGKAGQAALKRGSLQRIDLVGLRKPDIINYLPVDYLVADANSWDDLFVEYKNEVPIAERAQTPFKTWINRHRASRKIDRDSVGEAAKALADDIPDDLAAIVEGL